MNFGSVRTTKYPLEQCIDHTCHYVAPIQYGSTSNPCHILRIHPSDRAHNAHLVLNALHKILHLNSPPSSDTSFAFPNLYHLLSRDVETPLTGPHKHFQTNTDASDEDLALWLVFDLTELPVEIRVEREIALAWPEHRTLQQAYLRSRINRLDFIYNPQRNATSPHRSLDMLRQINGTYLQECMHLSGSPAALNFETYRREHLDGTLLDMVDGCTKPGHLGDREIIDQWAEHLRIRDWYVWYPQTQ